MNDAEAILPAPRRRRSRQEGTPQQARSPGPTGGRKGHTVPWLTLPADRDEATLLWRALEALSWERRWLVWVAPPRRPTTRELLSRGLDVRHLLFVQLRPHMNSLTVTEQALASGRCSAVLAWPDVVSKEQLARLRTAARQGDALCLLWPPLTGAVETGVRGKKTAASAG